MLMCVWTSVIPKATSYILVATFNKRAQNIKNWFIPIKFYSFSRADKKSTLHIATLKSLHQYLILEDSRISLLYYYHHHLRAYSLIHFQMQAAFLRRSFPIAFGVCKTRRGAFGWRSSRTVAQETADGITTRCASSPAKPLLQAVIFLKFTANAISVWQLLRRCVTLEMPSQLWVSSGVRKNN